MASFTCHVVCVTKRIRLERLVRPPHAELAPNLATAQPLSRTVQQVWPNGLRLALAGAKARTLDSRGLELSARLVQSRLGRSSLAESRACPKPRYCRGDCRCLHRACEVQKLRISERYRLLGTREQQCGKQGLTPKLSRAAQWSKAHGKLFLPCGLRN